MDLIALHAEQPPLLIVELLLKLRIRDVMSTEIVSARRNETMRSVQIAMKENGISGVPIVEDRRLFGLVSIDDIIQSLEAGTIDDPVEKYMSTHMIVLKENMPLSLGISYFRKYHFGRFPVLNKDNEMVGIITSRDINLSLLMELTKELDKAESQEALHVDVGEGHMFQVYPIHKFDFEHAGKVATDIKRVLKKRGVPSPLIRRVAVASYELEMNQVVHSDGGTLTCLVEPGYAELIAQDTGPGIDDLEESMKEGVTTANEWIQSMGFGAGMGLPNIKRVADEFAIESSREQGTKVRVLIHLTTDRKVT